MSTWESLDMAPFNGGEVICAHFYWNPAVTNKDPHYRVFFKHKDGTINSVRKYQIDIMNSYIKSEMISDSDIVEYMLCNWVNNEYRECRRSGGWNTSIKDLKDFY